MAIYDTEEEQLEQLKRWWQVNNKSLIAGLIGGAVLITGYNVWQRYQKDTRAHASQLYQEMLNSAANKNEDSVIKISEKLSNDFGSSAYADFGVLQAAKAKMLLGDMEGAKTLLKTELHNIDNPELQHLCRLRLIQLMLATKEYEPALKLIQEIDPATASGFSANYDELQGDIYVAMDRLDEARRAYQSALRSGKATPFVQFKLDDITAPPLTESAIK